MLFRTVPGFTFFIIIFFEWRLFVGFLGMLGMPWARTFLHVFWKEGANLNYPWRKTFLSLGFVYKVPNCINRKLLPLRLSLILKGAFFLTIHPWKKKIIIIIGEWMRETTAANFVDMLPLTSCGQISTTHSIRLQNWRLSMWSWQLATFTSALLVR